ncbi:MAG: ubiquinone biosynthesis regulatory protein kinase UbiB [Gammaproteobacteria bacterium]
MLRPSQILRLININIVLVRHGLDEVVFAIHLFRPFRFLLYLWPVHWIRNKDISNGVRIRRALEDLGPIFIKFGQMLSTRRDLLPDDIAEELAKLQDAVPPFPGESARKEIERALGEPVDKTFARFDEQPLASASVAQVHEATLHDGAEVVVKVLRPGIERVIRRDLGILFVIARLAEHYWADGRRLRPVAVVGEYEKIILDELDLMREAANASQLRRNFEDSSELYVPDTFWHYNRKNVMVMERIHGIPISNIAQLRRQGVDMKRLSSRGVRIFFTQVFVHNFFHADMHPGNIFVSYEHPQDPQYLAVDFGIMGTLSPSDQRYLAENFVAFFDRDYRRVSELHIESGWVPAGTRVDEFESAIRTVCEPIFQKPLAEISFGNLLLRLFQTARRFNMEIQPQLVLLQKTLLNIEGLGRQLDPELNLWETAKPFLDSWMRNQVGVGALIRGVNENLPKLVKRLPELPDMVYSAIRQAESMEASAERNRQELVTIRDEIRAANWRTVAAIVCSLGVVALVMLFLN